ncbi:Eggshell protein 2A precursor, putative [Perkinsus marinus ATCC 50983]|uniref:Eggshell protein 2A, putative n=1 Tax=Perkinsus marinus (strain ATCC 50983 / TXsc) TaxID=423536 RepID=C5L0X7_PERM5|nr:Eggshell protein 2A precursor, putative [Perkinsus marinus ATCC 50983]EER09619.1 Eggshell protein 2A precursor, putative [Perkinsus marinus ATCC 50983]|eukprot:XP_002777824.1 Eggshell protein 2A precursor, putative [Perkinsus marinus ATCC 50983]
MPQQQMPMPAGYSDPYTENVGYGGGGGGAWGDGYYGGKGGGRETTSATGNGAGTGQAGENHGEQTFSGYSGGWGGASTGQMGWPKKGGGSKQEVREGDCCYAAKGAPPPDPSSPEYLAAVAAAYWPMMGAYSGSAGPDGSADPSATMAAAYGGWPGWWGAGGKGKSGRREGDWDCPACGDMNFASRVVCRKCGAAPSYGSAMGAYGVGSMSNSIPSNLAPTGAATGGGSDVSGRS